MDRFWKAALGIAGIGAIAFFVFYSLYRQWLSLPIFPQLTQDQAFILMLVFLGLTFLALLSGVIAWFLRGGRAESEDAALHRLDEAWSDVNYIDCASLVGPDVNKAADALRTTALYWKKNYVTKAVLLEKHGSEYCELFEQLDACTKVVPGYEKLGKHCRDFLTAAVRTTYVEIKKQLRR